MLTDVLPNRISLSTLMSLAKDLGISPDNMLISMRSRGAAWPELIYIEKDQMIAPSSGQEGPAKREDPAVQERIPGLGD